MVNVYPIGKPSYFWLKFLTPSFDIGNDYCSNPRLGEARESGHINDTYIVMAFSQEGLKGKKKSILVTA